MLDYRTAIRLSGWESYEKLRGLREALPILSSIGYNRDYRTCYISSSQGFFYTVDCLLCLEEDSCLWILEEEGDIRTLDNSEFRKFLLSCAALDDQEA